MAILSLKVILLMPSAGLAGRKDPPWNRGILFRHVGRSANSVADFLAKIGVQKGVLEVEFFVI